MCEKEFKYGEKEYYYVKEEAVAVHQGFYCAKCIEKFYNKVLKKTL